MVFFMKLVIVKSWTVSFWRPEVGKARFTFFESVFCLLENEFFVAVFSVLDNLKALISSLSSVISFSYFWFFISCVCDGLHDDEIPCLWKRWIHLMIVFFLLGLELVFVKRGLFIRARAVTWSYKDCTQFSLSSVKSVALATGFGLCFR